MRWLGFGKKFSSNFISRTESLSYRQESSNTPPHSPELGDCFRALHLNGPLQGPVLDFENTVVFLIEEDFPIDKLQD